MPNPVLDLQGISVITVNVSGFCCTGGVLSKRIMMSGIIIAVTLPAALTFLNILLVDRFCVSPYTDCASSDALIAHH